MTRTPPRSDRGAVSSYLTSALALLIAGMFLFGLWAEVSKPLQQVPVPQAVVDTPQATTLIVLDADTGRPVAQARVRTVSGSDVRTNPSGSDGVVGMELIHPALVQVTAPGHAPRVLAVAPGQNLAAPLSARTGRGISIRFAGDAMLGRRFYEPTLNKKWLEQGDGVEQHLGPLRAIAPLLGDADLTVVNLETSLVDQPYFAGARPARFHPDKDLVFASAPATARALQLSGVDVVDLGNNHVYDALSDGLDSTISAVEQAGLVHFGAGRTVAEAWRPAYVSAAGQRVAFVGCTTVTGDRYSISYVAGPGQGGAAACDPVLLAESVRTARAHADVVVVMMHGGVEYQNTQVGSVRELSQIAVGAGASLVINGHPHVIGGIVSAGDAYIAETMGNLMFDQNLWATLRSYLLRVDLVGGRPVRAWADPFAISDFAPVPTTGAVADSSARVASGLLDGPMRLADGSASTTPYHGRLQRTLSGARGQISHVPTGWWLTPGQQGVTPGEDLLFGTGSFEEMTTDADAFEPLLWSHGKYTELSNAAACTGTRGLHLIRKPASDFDVIATPAHRIAVTPGERLTATVAVRSSTGGARLELRWYARMNGASAKVTTTRIGPVRVGGCETFQVSATVPRGMTAVQPYLRLVDPGDRTLAGELSADDVRLIRWAPEATGGRLYDVVRFDAAGRLRFAAD